MMTYKEEFIKFMEDSGVLKFGEFTLKSGRKAPYFLNAGSYCTGDQLVKLGHYYAQCIKEHDVEFDTLFGPAYKGMPLACSTAIALSNDFGINANYCFDRKEVKDHGEGGMFVGKNLEDGEKVIYIEDVMTSGKALRETLPKLKAQADINVTAMFISVDRMEKGTGEKSAVQQTADDFGIPVYSIVNIYDIIECIKKGIIGGKEYLDDIVAYIEKYGAK